jgi:lysophospholipid acyltransferase
MYPNFCNSQAHLLVPPVISSRRCLEENSRQQAVAEECFYHRVCASPPYLYLSNMLIVPSVALFYLIGLFDLWDGIRTLLWSSGGAYAIAYFVKGPFMPWIGFAFLMGHMSINHIYRQWANAPSSVDITGAQMVLIMKLTAFCWNVYDGQQPESELTEVQKERAIKVLPDFLDYAGYVLFFPGLMAGPAFDYVDYKNFISTTMFQLPPGTDPSKAPPTRKKRKIPRSGTPAAWKAAYGLLWIVLFLQFSNYYWPGYFLSPDYMKYGIVRRIWQLYMFGFTSRMKYYGVWSLTEGACILSGIGYNGISPTTGRASWDRLTNVRPMEIETAQNVRAYLGGWNINTNNWLRNYMYLRVTPKGKKPGFRATLATFVTSAFWHGFYPGYYLAFVLASFLQTIAKRTYHDMSFTSPFCLVSLCVNTSNQMAVDSCVPSFWPQMARLQHQTSDITISSRS